MAKSDAQILYAIVYVGGGHKDMEKTREAEMLLHVWVRLDEAKSLLLVIEKGLEEEAKWKSSEMHGIISIIKRELEGLIGEIDQAV